MLAVKGTGAPVVESRAKSASDRVISPGTIKIRFVPAVPKKSPIMFGATLDALEDVEAERFCVDCCCGMFRFWLLLTSG